MGIKVLHVCSGNIYGGVETALVTLARYRHLCPQMELSFAVCFPGRLQQELSPTGVPLYDLGYVRIRYPWTVWRVRQRLRKILSRHQFDVVVVHSAWAQAIFVPVVQSIGIHWVRWLRNPLDSHYWLEQWASRLKPDLLIANSRFTADFPDSLYRQIPCEVVYNPLAALEIIDPTQTKISVRKEFHLAQDSVVIVQASRMEEWKGHALHLQALALLQDIPGWVCWQSGGAQRPQERKYWEKLQSLSKQLGIADRVFWLGQRSDVRRLLAAADIFCQPNLGPEPFGNVFVEALYAALPVVTTAMGGALEVVNDSCGILVPANDKATLADVLKKLIADCELRKRLGQAGPSQARKLCDVKSQIVKLHNTLLKTITSQR